MLACDLLMDVRASRSLSGDQVTWLERVVFGNGRPDRAGLDLLFLIDAYQQRADPRWGPLLARAALAALAEPSDVRPATSGVTAIAA